MRKFKSIFALLSYSAFIFSLIYYVRLRTRKIHEESSRSRVQGEGGGTKGYNVYPEGWIEISGFTDTDRENETTKIFLYSAFTDLVIRSNPLIRIISYAPWGFSSSLSCIFFSSNFTRLNRNPYPATIKFTTVWWYTANTYAIARISCDAPPPLFRSYVALVPTFPVYPKGTLPPPLSLLKVHETFAKKKLRKDNGTSTIVPSSASSSSHHNFGLCVQPVYDFNNVLGFLEWLEFHKLMGVSHFTFYNISISPDISTLLTSSKSLLNVEVLVLPFRSKGDEVIPQAEEFFWAPKRIHMHGQTAANSDCIMRYRGVAEYVVFLDLDEFLVPDPSMAQDYVELMPLLEAVQRSRKKWTVVQYQVRSTFFGRNLFLRDKEGNNKEDQMEDGNLGDLKLMDLLSHREIQRDAAFFKGGARSKFISTPGPVIEPGVHFLESTLNDDHFIESEVPLNFARVHHYRDYLCEMDCKSQNKTVVDTTMRNFTQKVYQNVRERVGIILKNMKGLDQKFSYRVTHINMTMTSEQQNTPLLYPTL